MNMNSPASELSNGPSHDEPILKETPASKIKEFDWDKDDESKDGSVDWLQKRTTKMATPMRNDKNVHCYMLRVSMKTVTLSRRLEQRNSTFLRISSNRLISLGQPFYTPTEMTLMPGAVVNVEGGFFTTKFELSHEELTYWLRCWPLEVTLLAKSIDTESVIGEAAVALKRLLETSPEQMMSNVGVPMMRSTIKKDAMLVDPTTGANVALVVITAMLDDLGLLPLFGSPELVDSVSPIKEMAEQSNKPITKGGEDAGNDIADKLGDVNLDEASDSNDGPHQEPIVHLFQNCTLYYKGKYKYKLLGSPNSVSICMKESTANPSENELMINDSITKESLLSIVPETAVKVQWFKENNVQFWCEPKPPILGLTGIVQFMVKSREAKEIISVLEVFCAK